MMMNWKGFGKKRPRPNFIVYSGMFLERLRKTMKNINQDRWSLGLRFEPRTS
jgi:hypothetical protein